ncbi:MAG: peptide chain release factor 2 [Acholeplasmataceae bacterium]|jgi:peptide chain release factor 2|nr:peptide chain release factor 2 [Acholeplasmataceae bacterium]
MERHELNRHLADFKTRVAALAVSLDLKNLETQYEKLIQEQLTTGFWDDVKKAQAQIELANEIKEKISKVEFLTTNHQSIAELASLAEDGSEDYQMVVAEIKDLEKELKTFELLVLLNGKYDKNNCILNLQAGAGGTESMDWCMMLYRMYLRYFGKKRYRYEILDYQPGEEAGLKSVSIRVEGRYAYGHLKAEAGVHRLVRISPFDASKRRHTSFASCEVIPEIKDLEKIKLNEEDLRIDVFRSGGAGGQSVNTTDSAVRVTHLPSGIVVTCQNERSQIKNKETALNVLKSRLLQLEEQKKEAELSALKGEQKEIAWGSQIRSYVFHPYQMVKDHRTNIETSQLEDVMDGDLDIFIDGYLRQVKK